MKYLDEKIVDSGSWLVEEDTTLNSLVIGEGASLSAPEGKEVFLTQFGVGKEIRPGDYKGDIVLSVVDSFSMPCGGLCRTALPKNYQTAILIEDNEVKENNSVSAVVKGGSVTGTEINDITIRSTVEGFNGITIRGDSECTINRARIYLDGDHGNDYVGYGSGIHCAGTSRVTINDSDIRTFGVIRNTLHAGEKSKVVVNNSKLFGYSPESLTMNPTWQLGLRGSSRAAMLVDFADVEFNNCYISSNGWGTVSIDGGFKNRIYFKDCNLELLGARARGYCTFAIGDTDITYDNTNVDVQGYGMLMGASAIIPGVVESRGIFTNGSKIHSDLYGMKIFYTKAGTVKMDKGVVIESDEASFIASSCHATLDLDDVTLKPGNGIILQLMDNTYTGLGAHPYIAHVGKEDEYIPGRDLALADPTQDVFVNFSNMETCGDLLNSTTNLDVTDPQDESTVEIFDYNEMDYEFEPLDFDMENSFPISSMRWLRVSGDFNPTQENDVAMIGPRNMVVNLKNASLTGVVSSAKAAYRDGLTIVDVRDLEELDTVVQTPAEAINNGTIVSIDADSVWTVTGDCYLTCLKMDEGAKLVGAEGKTVKMTVDGTETPIQAGTYTGKIKLELL